MAFLQLLKGTNLLSDTRKLELYPPFLFMGAKITFLSPDYRSLRVRLPLRWYGSNHYGTMFGGFMAAMADPLPAMMCHKIFPEAEIWTKKLSVQFLRPGKTDLELRIDITDEEIQTIRTELEKYGRSNPVFHFYYFDKSDHKIAGIKNTVAIRLKTK